MQEQDYTCILDTRLLQAQELDKPAPASYGSALYDLCSAAPEERLQVLGLVKLDPSLAQIYMTASNADPYTAYLGPDAVRRKMNYRLALICAT